MFSNQLQPILTSDKNATIVAGQTVSDIQDLKGGFLVGLTIPANFDGTGIKFQGSRDGVSFIPLYNTAGVELTITITGSIPVGGIGVSIVPSDFAMWQFLKLVTTSAQATTDTVIGLVTRPLA